MRIFPRISGRRPAGFVPLALALLAATPDGAEAQTDRRSIFLSDRRAPRPDCRPSPRPGRLPALDVLADSAALTAGIDSLAMQYRQARDTSFVLLSVSLDAREGAAERVREIEYFIPREMIEPLKALVSRTIRPQRAGGYLRLRIHPGTRRVLIGRSEVCEPRGPDRMSVQPLAGHDLSQVSQMSFRVLVDPDGRPRSVSPSRGSGNRAVDAYVVRWLQQSRFAPGLVDGVATEMQYEQDVRFSR
ncbi:MAG TPA: energy transducer TonB [Longimicrobium sp.]|nr:energy transducer TonB [Longimicrobium sp.]